METTSRPRQLTVELLSAVSGRYRATVSATEPGIVAGLGNLEEMVAQHALGKLKYLLCEGDEIGPGQPIIEITGSAVEIANAENLVLGPLGFAGGIATRCREIRARAPSGLHIACGGWKKLPAALKPLLRSGLDAGGVSPRLVPDDFVYIDKNTVRLLGGLAAAASAGRRLDHGDVALQVTSPAEALVAARAGANIIMDDTGSVDVLREIQTSLEAEGMRDQITLAFAGGVTVDDLPAIRAAGADVVDLGRAVLNAPLWDLHLEVQKYE
ncbi:hypothetical protein [Mycobacterium sp. E796]|uniref:hypothetical protein n=1 Tax=Mycobacterium sp. E796 TaxID=1834151 RepID=UPI000800D382|nr:hypothetical protein [Mycobacterium sp. E796]OBI51995.1 hypothetical protein A5706_02015 [Mycobacterium sp. E796]